MDEESESDSEEASFLALAGSRGAGIRRHTGKQIKTANIRKKDTSGTQHTGKSNHGSRSSGLVFVRELNGGLEDDAFRLL